LAAAPRYSSVVRAVVRKQAILLGLGMGTGILSASLGSLASWALHVSGFWIFITAWGLCMLILVRIRPALFR
jgi:hypothetical protein